MGVALALRDLVVNDLNHQHLPVVGLAVTMFCIGVAKGALHFYVMEELHKYKEAPKIVQECVKYYGRCLEWMPLACRQDYEVVLVAVMQDGECIKFADMRFMKNDQKEDIVVAAAEQTGTVFTERKLRRLLPRSLRKSHRVCCAAARGTHHLDLRDTFMKALKEEDLFEDENLILKLLEDGNDGGQCTADSIFVNLNKINSKLLDDEGFILDCVKRKPGVYDKEFISEKMRCNTEIIKATLKKNGILLEHVPVEIKSDNNGVTEIKTDDVVEIAVRQNGLSLQYAQSKQIQPFLDSSGSKTHRDLVKIAVKQNGLALQFVEEATKKPIVLEAVRNNGNALKYAKPPFAEHNFQNDDCLVLAALEKTGAALEFASEDIRKNPTFVLKACTNDGYALKYSLVPLEHKRYLEIVKAAVRSAPGSMELVSKSVREDIRRELQEEEDCF